MYVCMCVRAKIALYLLLIVSVFGQFRIIILRMQCAFTTAAEVLHLCAFS